MTQQFARNAKLCWINIQLLRRMFKMNSSNKRMSKFGFVNFAMRRMWFKLRLKSSRQLRMLYIWSNQCKRLNRKNKIYRSTIPLCFALTIVVLCLHQQKLRGKSNSNTESLKKNTICWNNSLNQETRHRSCLVKIRMSHMFHENNVFWLPSSSK